MSSSFVVVTLSVLLLLTSVFMILLVLIQRGRGGGLAGAFGGMGGQSAFGTRAGDVFTKITVVVAIIFILLASLLGKSMRAAQQNADREIGSKFTAGADSAPDETESGDDVAPLLDAVGQSAEAGDGSANSDESVSSPPEDNLNVDTTPDTEVDSPSAPGSSSQDAASPSPEGTDGPTPVPEPSKAPGGE